MLNVQKIRNIRHHLPPRGLPSKGAKAQQVEIELCWMDPSLP